MTYSGCFYLIGYFEKIPNGKLPMSNEPHVTLLPQFMLPDEKIVEFGHKLQLMTREQDFHSFNIIPGEKEQFTSLLGEKVEVTKVKEHSNEIERYHEHAVQIVEQCNGENVSPWVRNKFSAHVTGWEHPEQKTITTLSLIHHREGFGNDVHNILTIELNR